VEPEQSVSIADTTHPARIRENVALLDVTLPTRTCRARRLDTVASWAPPPTTRRWPSAVVLVRSDVLRPGARQTLEVRGHEVEPAHRLVDLGAARRQTRSA
jgi:hypothetical protein